MSVKVEINGRVFTLSWDEFEHAMQKRDITKDGPITILNITGGVNYATCA